MGRQEALPSPSQMLPGELWYSTWDIRIQSTGPFQTEEESTVQEERESDGNQSCNVER